jgi:hypothetical protein
MKALSIITAAFILVFGAVVSRAANVDRISAATGVPVATLQAERASTGLAWGGWRKLICWRTLQARVSTTLSRCTSPGKAGVKLRAITDLTSASS